MFKKTFALILSLILAAPFFSVPAQAQEDYTQWKQADPQWNSREAWPRGQYPLAELSTMAGNGDQVTALAMLLKQYGLAPEEDFTPLKCLETLKKAEAFDEKGQLLWFSVQEAFPGFCFENRVEFSLQKISALYDYGHPCILQLKGKDGPGRHVALQSVDRGKIQIMDPGSETTKLTDLSSVEAVYYFTLRSGSDKFEYAKFPAPAMEVTQLAYESFSHVISNAIDIIPHGDLIAPFRCTVTFTDPSWGYVVLQSTEKVLFANGTWDYMTVSMVHSEDIGEMVRAQKEGRILCQGEPIYRAGGMGRWNPNEYRDHVHLAAYQGHVSGVTDDGYYGCGNIYPYDAFFVDPEFTTKYHGRGEGYKSTDSFMYHKAPADYRGLWISADVLKEDS